MGASAAGFVERERQAAALGALTGIAIALRGLSSTLHADARKGSSVDSAQSPRRVGDAYHDSITHRSPRRADVLSVERCACVDIAPKKQELSVAVAVAGFVVAPRRRVNVIVCVIRWTTTNILVVWSSVKSVCRRLITF